MPVKPYCRLAVAVPLPQKMNTPITYYGGKQRMLRHILPLVPEHFLYDEPFFGSGSVFWAKEPARVEFINDHNTEVINFYRVLKLRFPALKREIDATLHSERQHRETGQVYGNSGQYDEVKRAWAFHVLPHQTFYAVMCNSWKCYMKRNGAKQFSGKKAALTEEYAKRLEHTSFFCSEALDVLRKTDRENAFHYIDPPYFGLRDYGVSGKIGVEDDPEDYIHRFMEVFMEVYRILKPAGTLWLNLGDSYNSSGKCNGGDPGNCIQSNNKEAQKTKPTRVKGLKKKDLTGIPWLVAFALRSKGWLPPASKRDVRPEERFSNPSWAAKQQASLPGNWSVTS
jgi:DNA adenine methylase